MTKTLVTKLAVGIGLCCLSAGSALASTNLFTPVTGAAFTPTFIDPNGGNIGTRFRGLMENTSTTSTLTVMASLGHAQGTSNGFTIFGIGNGNSNSPFTCTIRGVPTNGGQPNVSAPASTTASGVFNFHIQTSFPSGDQMYFITCTLPPSTSGSPAIIGVRPDN